MQSDKRLLAWGIQLWFADINIYIYIYNDTHSHACWYVFVEFSQQGFVLQEEDLLPLAERDNLHRPIPDYLNANFRHIMDNEVQRRVGPTGTTSLLQCKDMYIHLVNFCRQSSIPLDFSYYIGITFWWELALFDLSYTMYLSMYLCINHSVANFCRFQIYVNCGYGTGKCELSGNI